MISSPLYKRYIPSQLTTEQDLAVRLATEHDGNIKINALAGTGKTSTLRAIAAQLSSQRILYLAFNKTIQVEASQSFPPNVTARTIHSLAYRAMRVYESDLHRKLSESPTLRDYAEFLGLSLKSEHVLNAILCLKEAIREFQQSSDSVPSSKHIPRQEILSISSVSERRWVENFVEETASKLWKSMTCADYDSFPISHDTYLKMWQLSQPRISGVDIIMLDEAQDANPVMIDILKKQKIRLILVGDSWQQIYSFRGAVNAMNNVEAPLSCYLTQSFRFGSRIADLANQVLFLRGAPKLLRGLESKTSRLGPLPQGEQYTVIFRYNIELLEEAIDLSTNQYAIYVLGTLDKTISLVMDVYYLFIKDRRKIRDPKIKTFQSWSDLLWNLDYIDDVELKKSIRFVEKYTFETPTLISSVKKYAVNQAELSDVILTTGHKSKGQEWNYVRISEDFYDAIKREEEEELNLLYVAFTRAIRFLEVPRLILESLESMKEKIRPSS